MLKSVRNCCGALCSLFNRKKKKEPINSNLTTHEQILSAPQVKNPEAGKKTKKTKKTQEIVKPPVSASQVKTPEAGKKKSQEIVKSPFPTSKVKTPKAGKKKKKTQEIVKPVFPAPQVKTPEAEDEIKTQVIVEPLETVEKNVLSSEVKAADEDVSRTVEKKSKNLSETTTTLETIRNCCGALCSLCDCKKKKVRATKIFFCNIN
ncbi:uncharacterized protein LOC121397655 [Xenopus laevis]|uniref:Uncharacterized protein LOC121397655 n=1 Tax=Xenopus laevis TaxID=8355 RepID=A0A8J1LM47_XENLA|nr:uncharacterized protein LOC121397655 [Xenopus laevis]